jgi:hypothetical protein
MYHTGYSIDKPMKKHGELSKETPKYKDLYTAIMAPISILLKDSFCWGMSILDTTYEAVDLKESLILFQQFIRKNNTICLIFKKNI